MTYFARLHILVTGMLSPDVASTWSLVIDGDHVIVIDPGMAPSQESITEPLRGHGLTPGDVTDVVISHHHPDHRSMWGSLPRLEFTTTGR